MAKKDIETKREAGIVEGKEFKAVPLRWNVPEDHVTPFASHVVVQAEEDIFRISFFQAKPPIITDKSEPSPSKVRADCIASVFVTPNKVDKLIEILRLHLYKYRATKKRSSDAP